MTTMMTVVRAQTDDRCQTSWSLEVVGWGGVSTVKMRERYEACWFATAKLRDQQQRQTRARIR